jgi:ferredoxin
VNHLEVAPLTCISSGSCEAVSEELFEIQDDGTLKVLQPDVPADLLELAEKAVRDCPARALTLTRSLTQ